MVLHKCGAPVVRAKVGGLTDRNAICGKLASVRVGKRYLCAEHASKEGEGRDGQRHVTAAAR